MILVMGVLLNEVWLQHLGILRYQKIKNLKTELKYFYSNGRMGYMGFLIFIKFRQVF